MGHGAVTFEVLSGRIMPFRGLNRVPIQPQLPSHWVLDRLPSFPAGWFPLPSRVCFAAYEYTLFICAIKYLEPTPGGSGIPKLTNCLARIQFVCLARPLRIL